MRQCRPPAAILSSPLPTLMPMYAIRRTKRALNAWCWHVTFRRRGKAYSKMFFDLACGGSGKALKAAIAWRDKTIAWAGIVTLRDFCKQKRSNNTSGVPGVHFLRSARQPMGLWQAKVKLPDGRTVHRSFSVRRVGYDEAFRLAVAARAELLQLVEDRPYLKHPTAKRLGKQHA